MKLFGKNPVIERLRFNPSSIRKIYIQQGFGDSSYIRKKAKQWGIPVFTVPKSKMLKIGRNTNTQGVLVDTEDFVYVPYDELLESAFKKKRCPIFLDGLNDPQNFGAIIRSLACLGKFALVIPTHGSVGITESVLRVASGGDNYVPVSKVANLKNAIKLAKKAGFFIAGTVVKDGEDITKANLSFPLGVVIGSEQKGIRDVILKNIDLKITIPMAADTLSFNVAHAATIICYEITKQKKSKE